MHVSSILNISGLFFSSQGARGKCVHCTGSSLLVRRVAVMLDITHGTQLLYDKCIGS